MKKLLFSLICLILIAELALADGKTTSNPHAKKEGPQPRKSNLTIRQDPRIDSLLNRHIRQNQKTHVSGSGYRIQIYTASGAGAREKAINIKTQVLTDDPDMDVYVQFTSPDWKVRIGNFRSRSDAMRVKQELNSKYPNSFIVPDHIEYTKTAEKPKKQGLKNE
ncbi:MAG: SPOR domain-containing protein [Bacteroidota bacterium]|nr:SPOR domain-containing protein [Bacteroidota bacterium]MDP4205722.1 SPOR domain-containing protein [Bacteroidota bacterium]